MNMKLNDEVNVLFLTFMLVKYRISDNYISTDVHDLDLQHEKH